MVFLVIINTIISQTDWSGEDSILGPVNDWETNYWIHDSVTTATAGQVSIIATQWDYTNWTEHIVESNSGIHSSTQGLMPADIDNDGITDLVAHTNNEVVWYKHDGFYNFSDKNVVGSASSSGWAPCVYPSDLNKDGNIDILVATNGNGLGWFENQGLPNWQWHGIDNSIGYHRVSSSDVDRDGDVDIIAVDDAHSLNHVGDIYLFRNDGNQSFTTKELIADLSSMNGWRVYPVDFNKDGYPDLYSAAWANVHIFLNDTTGNFSLVWSSFSDEWDGAWPSDIDGDGDMDLVVSNQYDGISGDKEGYYALLNDGTGTNFDTLLLISNVNNYSDGAMSCDIDLDGFSDIAGSFYNVGWFRQDPANPLTFTLYSIDNLPSPSHWIYAVPLGKCTPTIDLLVTCGGYHLVYENQMLTAFADTGILISSILDLGAVYNICYFGYKACIPNNMSLVFYWRAGADSADIVTQSWNGPYTTQVGVETIDSFAVSGDVQMFQYKAEFRGGDGIAVLYEVWLNYDCIPSGVEETLEEKVEKSRILQFVDNKLLLLLPCKEKINLAIYDISGRLIKSVYTGYLPAGKYEFEIPSESGVYFAKVHFTKNSKTLKFIKLN